MKIGILTLPLHSNYGGILQAYALQVYLKKRGYETVVLDRQMNQGWQHKLKLLVKKILFKSKYNTLKEKEIIAKNPRHFINEYIKPKTKPLHSERELSRVVNELNLDYVVVGSDQVWRIKYLGDNLYNYFLDFVKTRKLKKISYAASFGEDEWQENASITRKVRSYLNEFDKVSVREDTGVVTCKEIFDINASHHIDPTLLLDANEYIELCDKKNEQNHRGDILVYILDITEDKQKVIQSVAQMISGTPFLVNAQSVSAKDDLKNRIYPTVTSWLRGFHNSKYVVADSFHGCIFALLFNKPFIAYGNQERGLTRFTSLLKMFGLEERLIINSSELTEDLIRKEIDWKSINSIIQAKRLETDDYFERI